MIPCLHFAAFFLWHPVLQSPFQQPFKLIYKQLLGTFYIEVQKKNPRQLSLQDVLGSYQVGELIPPASPWGWTQGEEEDGACGRFYDVRSDASEWLQHMACSLISREDP